MLMKNIYFKKNQNDEPIWADTYEYAMLCDEWFTKITMNGGICCSQKITFNNK